MVQYNLSSAATQSRPQKGFEDQYLLNVGLKELQDAPAEHSIVLLNCIELPHGLKTFVLSIFEWPLKTGFTVQCLTLCMLGSFHAFVVFSKSFFSKKCFIVKVFGSKLFAKVDYQQMSKVATRASSY